ncbi:MAG: ChbG/HpnK family deacetylase [Acidobacteriota bacterium]
MKQLIVNADDFGFTRDVNRGIVEAHLQGILTSTTLMGDTRTNPAAFADAVALAMQHPTLDVGCHLVLVESPPFPRTIPRLVTSVLLGRIQIYEAFAAQVRRIMDAGIAPTHLDTHKHTHLLPQVLEAVARVSQEFKIPWVRRPFDFLEQPGGIGWKNKLMHLRGNGFEKTLSKYGCRSTDWFSGFAVTGTFDTAKLVAIIRALPEGTTEFMCHPGVLGDELRRAPGRLIESRAAELQALTSKQVRAALDEAGVELTNFRELTSDPD